MLARLVPLHQDDDRPWAIGHFVPRLLRCCLIIAIAALWPYCARAEDRSHRVAVAAVSTLHQPQAAIIQSVTARGEWLVVETPNFRVWSRLDRQQLITLARRCEQVRGELQSKWLPQVADETWTPKAEVVVHRTVGEYRRATGNGSDGSSGSTTVTLEHERVVQRRIDLRSDAEEWSTSSLPHEMTHLVIADRFTRRQLPRWADEGMAVLAESPAKQLKRRQAALTDGSRGTFSPVDVLRQNGYPAAQRHAGFYAGSAELVAFLVQRKGAETFLAFVESAMTEGAEQALRTFYGIDGFAGLQKELKRTENSTRQSASAGS